MLTGSALLPFCLHRHAAVTVEWQLSPYQFPLLLAVALIVLSALSLLQLAAERRLAATAPKHSSRLALRAVGILALYILLLPYSGFIIATALCLAALFLLLGERRALLIVVLAVGFALLLWLLFAYGLHVMLPRGVWLH